jgi:predicted O-methyltransferase YrrM
MNIEPYLFAFDNEAHPMAMDRRHIEMLHALAMDVPAGGVCVEIGSHRGASTAAFIEALNAGKDFTLHIVEPWPTDDLRRVLSMCGKPDRIIPHYLASQTFVVKPVDLWFIDGDHRVPALIDLYNALACEARVIAMHDTKAHVATSDTNDCMGAWLAALALSNHPDRVWFEDCEKRPGEWTHRGFGWSSVPNVRVSDGANNQKI